MANNKLLGWSFILCFLCLFLTNQASGIQVLSQSANTDITLTLSIGQLEFENPLAGTETVQGYNIIDWQDADYQAPSWYDDWTVSSPGAIHGNVNEIWMRNAGHSAWATTQVPSQIVSIHLLGDINDGLAQVLVDNIEVARLDMGTSPNSQTALIIVKDLPFKCHQVQVNDQGVGRLGGDDVAILGAAALMKGYRVKWSQPPVTVNDSPYPDCFWGWDVRSTFGESILWFDCWNCLTQCHGDANCDGIVNLADMATLVNAFGGIYPYPPYDPCADFNHDLMVNDLDQMIMMEYFQSPIPPPYDCPQGPNAKFQILADDWACRDDRPITDIHWWGSYIGYDSPEPPNMGPEMFHIAIWTDVPAGEDRTWSHPGMVVWEWYVPRMELQERWVGCDFYPLSPDQEPIVDTCFEYHFIIPKELWFYQDPDPTQEGRIYWISIAAFYPDIIPPEYPWGWKCRPHFFNDDAVRIYRPTTPGIEWMFEEGEPLVDLQGNSMDMAFVLTTADIPKLDFGDAPEDNTSYPTTLARNGARHTVDNITFLGATVDIERDGQPTIPADGDDINPATGIDDEDGVVFPSPLYAGFPATVIVTASIDGYLDAWFDFNGDGDWDDANEQVFAIQPLSAGDNTLTFHVPPAVAGYFSPCYARFRFSSMGGLPYDGPAENGEVEDYLIEIGEVPYLADLGDAPDSTNNHGVAMTAYPDGTQANYPTVFQALIGVGGSPGPIHFNPQAVAWLGPAVSLELEADSGPDMDGINNIVPPANQPDNDVADDGLLFPVHMPHCRWTALDYLINVAGLAVPMDMYVNIWCDWNRDGDWNDVMECPKGPAPEWVVQNQLLVNLQLGMNQIRTPGFLCWHDPERPEEMWLRITLAEQPWRPQPQRDAGCGPSNGYDYGETEDYLIIPDTGCYECADLNCDRYVDLADLMIMSQQWLSSCP